MAFGGIVLSKEQALKTPYLDVEVDFFSAAPPGNNVGLATRLSGGVAGSNLFGSGSAATYAVRQGILCYRMNNSLQNKFALPYSIAVITSTGQDGSVSGDARIYRARANIAFEGNPLNPSADVGVKCAWGTGSSSVLKDWIQNAGPGVGQSGFGILFRPGGVIQWVMRATGSGAGVFYETTPLAWPDVLTAWVEVEFRIVDATPNSPARVDVLLNQTLVLTRYWTNPAGVSTPTLPLPSTTDGAQLTAPIVCTTTDGPPLYTRFRLQALPSDYVISHAL